MHMDWFVFIGVEHQSARRRLRHNESLNRVSTISGQDQQISSTNCYTFWCKSIQIHPVNGVIPDIGVKIGIPTGKADWILGGPASGLRIIIPRPKATPRCPGRRGHRKSRRHHGLAGTSDDHLTPLYYKDGSGDF